MGCKQSRDRNNGSVNHPRIRQLDNLDKTKTKTDNKNKQKLPAPRPPRKRKKDILSDITCLKHIDDHVKKIPRRAERSVESLGEYLIRPAKNDIEKVRAIYKWVTENIRYDTDSFFGRSPRTKKDPSSVLTSRSSLCDGFASIFQSLCNYAGIPVNKISGHSKGYSYKPGFDFKTETPTNHAWNAVYINGDWRFIETTWGAGYLDEKNQFVKNSTDYYFLTDPEQFVIDHFPYFDNDEVESSKWQLLKTPLSLEMFNQKIKPTRYAREWGINFTSHTCTVIEMTNTVDIEFFSKSSVLDDVKSKLFTSNRSSKDQYVAVKKRPNKHFVVTVSPPASGEYTLEIYGVVGSDETSLQCLITYLIKCKSVSKETHLLPKFHSYYGPVSNCTERGFKDVGKIPTSVKVPNGEYLLTLSVKEGTNVMALVKDINDVKLPQYTLLEMDKHLKLRARFPKMGYYRLVIYSKFQSDGYTPAVNILVHNLKEPTVNCPFPKTFPETLKFKCCLLEPLTETIPKNTKVRFRFKSLEMKNALLMRETIQKKTRHSWDTTVKTPPYGEVRISGNKDKVNTLYVVYSFKVK